MGRESEGERDNFSTWGFFWFGSFRETNDGKWMTGRQLVLSCFPAFFSLLSCMCGLLAPWTFNTLQFQWHIVHEWTQCLSMQGSMGEYVVSFWFWVMLLCLVGCFIKDHQQSGLIPPPPSHVCAPSPFHSSPPLPVASLSAPHAVWWKANQVEKEDPDMEIKCYTFPLIFPLSKPVK